MANGEEMPRPGTTASVERRVERLENQQDELQRTVNTLNTSVELVKVEQLHLKELMSAKFTSLELAIMTLTTKFDSGMTRLDSLYSDVSASPAGRQAEAEHIDFDERLKKVEGLAQSNRDWIVRAGGVVALAIVLITLFAPVIRHIIFGTPLT